MNGTVMIAITGAAIEDLELEHCGGGGDDTARDKASCRGEREQQVMVSLSTKHQISCWSLSGQPVVPPVVGLPSSNCRGDKERRPGKSPRQRRRGLDHRQSSTKNKHAFQGARQFPYAPGAQGLSKGYLNSQQMAWERWNNDERTRRNIARMRLPFYNRRKIGAKSALSA